MSNKLSRKVPYGEEDLYMELPELITHIQSLIDNKRPIHFVISDYYEIVLTNVDSMKLNGDNWNLSMSFVIEFYSNDSCISRVVLPQSKMYKKGLNEAYITVIEGIDYSKDKNYGEEIRVN